MGTFKGKVDFARIPGHWVLANLGKTVLRPGGIELTRTMLDGLNISPQEAVVEYAPGVGRTAKLTLSRNPRSYTAIEQDQEAASVVMSYLNGTNQTCVVADARTPELPDHSATVIYGEAMLTMQPDQLKEQIMREAHRMLQPGGRYAIHEMSLQPDDLSSELKDTIHKDISRAIRVNARPLTVEEWRGLLERNGFRVLEVHTAPMHLLRVKRVIADEGVLGTLKIGYRCLTRAGALKRVSSMRQAFMRYEENLGAVSIIAVKE
jgi:ubiquinone/menaquinone biosynthesis C-methylase UbiE